MTIPRDAGSDALGWAMYIDGSRSWFVHGGAHGGRAAGGVAAGACVGVLLDLTRGTLRFTVDDRPQVTTFTFLRPSVMAMYLNIVEISLSQPRAVS